MKREEKRRKFHDSLLNMLYPPPPSPSPPQEDDPPERLNKFTVMHNLDDLSDELGEEKRSSSDDNDGEGKLTRAQRKRIRKKKVKEAASQRRTIIGPLLPTAKEDTHGIDDGSEETKDHCLRHARPFDSEKNDTAAESAQTVSCLKQGKLRHRRMAKKMASSDKKQSTFASSNGSRKMGN